MKAIWYIKKFFNLIVVCVRLLIHCIRCPRKIPELLFSIFSTVNEFHQVTYGQLYDFEETQVFKKISEDNVFSQINFINVDTKVTRPIETMVLSALVSTLKPKTIFEIGTYNGFTTLHFAKNSPDDCIVYTLDLPPDFDIKAKNKISQYSYDDLLVVQLSMKHIDKRIYQKYPEKEKIKELFADSMDFDFTPYEEKMDVIFIDGNHSYDYVKSDTEHAMKMLSQNGVIVWHDYDYIIHRDVFKYLNSLSKSYKIFSVPNTRFAVYGKNLQ